jgi:hypothetical protein
MSKLATMSALMSLSFEDLMKQFLPANIKFFAVSYNASVEKIYNTISSLECSLQRKNLLSLIKRSSQLQTTLAF